jgi:hypothetical protein
MSVTETAIAAVSECLRGMLAQTLLEPPPLVEGDGQVVLASPSEVPRDRHTRLCVFLYRVHEHVLSRPEAMQIHGPLGFVLSYLVTPSGPDVGLCQHILGRVLRTCYSHSVLRVDEAGGELQLTLVRHALEEMLQIWSALDAPYQCSLCYEVRIVKLGDPEAH